MAGIGWKLQRLIDRGSLAGTAEAYLTGVAVTSAPWLLTTAALLSFRLAGRNDGSADFAAIEHTVTIAYALTVALSAPIHVVVSRYTADRLYDRQLDRIAAPLNRALALTLIGFAAVGIAAMACLRVPLAVAIPGAILTVIVAAQWLMLSVGGGLSSPGVILRAFGIGASLSAAAALMMERQAGAGPVGFLYGFAAGQLVTFVMLLHGVWRAIPTETDETARLAPAFREYRLLAVSSFAYHASIWADKVVVWLAAGRAEALHYAALASLAWFSVIPAFSWIYVQVETSFYRSFRSFYGGLSDGATLPELRHGATRITGDAFRILRGAALVQGAVTLVILLATPRILSLLGFPAASAITFRLCLIGSAFQVMTLLALLLLYYFDLRRDAVTVSIMLFAAEIGLTLGCWAAGLPPSLGYAAACALACASGLVLLRSRLQTLLLDTFQSQPFGSR